MKIVNNTKTAIRLCDILRRRREELKLTQLEVGAKLGFSPMGLSHFETGIRSPKLKTLEKWAELLGMEVEVRITNSIIINRPSDLDDFEKVYPPVREIKIE